MKPKIDHVLWIGVGLVFAILRDSLTTAFFRLAIASHYMPEFDYKFFELFENLNAVVYVITTMGLLLGIKTLFKNRPDHYIQPFLFIVGTTIRSIFIFFFDGISESFLYNFFYPWIPIEIFSNLALLTCCFIIWNHWRLDRKISGFFKATLFLLFIRVPNYGIVPVSQFIISKFEMMAGLKNPIVIPMIVLLIFCVPYIIYSKRYYPNLRSAQE